MLWNMEYMEYMEYGIIIEYINRVNHVDKLCCNHGKYNLSERLFTIVSIS